MYLLIKLSCNNQPFFTINRNFYLLNRCFLTPWIHRRLISLQGASKVTYTKQTIGSASLMSSDPVAAKNTADLLSRLNTMEENPKAHVHTVTKTIVSTPKIYKPVGPYSQAILSDKTLYVSGVLGMDIDAQIVCGGAEAQARQALDNLRHVLEAGGASLESVVKTTILLGNMDDFQDVNRVYAEYFPKDFPARATYQVGKLPMGAAVEIEAIALSGDLVVAEAGPCPCSRT